jgi:hypothetical protein
MEAKHGALGGPWSLVGKTGNRAARVATAAASRVGRPGERCGALSSVRRNKWRQMTDRAHMESEHVQMMPNHPPMKLSNGTSKNGERDQHLAWRGKVPDSSNRPAVYSRWRHGCKR